MTWRRWFSLGKAVDLEIVLLHIKVLHIHEKTFSSSSAWDCSLHADASYFLCWSSHFSLSNNEKKRSVHAGLTWFRRSLFFRKNRDPVNQVALAHLAASNI